MTGRSTSSLKIDIETIRLAKHIVLHASDREQEIFELGLGMGRAEGWHRGYADAMAEKAANWLAYSDQRQKDLYHEFLARYGYV